VSSFLNHNHIDNESLLFFSTLRSCLRYDLDSPMILLEEGIPDSIASGELLISLTSPSTK